MEADFNFDGYDQNDMDSCDLDEMDGCNLDYIDETTMAGNTGQDLNELYKTFSGEDTSDDSNEDPDTDMEDDYNSASYGNTSGPPNVKSLNKKMEYVKMKWSTNWNVIDHYDLKNVAVKVSKGNILSILFHDKDIYRLNLLTCGKTDCVDKGRRLLMESTRAAKCRNTALSLWKKYDDIDLDAELVELADRAADGDLNPWPVLKRYLREVELTVERRRRVGNWAIPLPRIGRLHMRATEVKKKAEAELIEHIRVCDGTRVKRGELDSRLEGAFNLACLMASHDPVQPPP